MNKQEIYQEIEKILNEINTISQSLSSSREFISENSNKRAQARLAELRVIFKLLQEELQKLIQFFEGKVVTSVTSMQTLSPGSKIIEGKDLALKTSPFLFSNEIT